MADHNGQEMKAPERAHYLEIKIGGDTIDDVRCGLEQILRDFALQGGARCGASGSPSVGWSIEYRQNPEMTHEKYFDAIQEYRKAKAI